MDRFEAAKQLTFTSTSLRDKYSAIATSKSEEANAKSQIFAQELANGTPVTQIDRLASAQTSKFSAVSTKLYYSILALEEERDHLRFMIKHQLEDYI